MDRQQAVIDVRSRVDRLPRVRLNRQCPQSLDRLGNFSPPAGRPGPTVWALRDDLIPFALGGNKVRHIEFLLGDALADRCDLVVWGAGVQSNNCRVMAAACASLGIECRLYLSRGRASTAVQGNLLLDHLYGAKVEIVDAAMGPELEGLLQAKAAAARAAGRRPYVWDRSRTMVPAAVSYVEAACEIEQQLGGSGLTPDAIYVASTGSTGAGLALAAKLIGWTCPVISVGYIRWPWDVAASMAAIATGAARALGLDTVLTAADITLDMSQIGDDYNAVPPASIAAIRRLAATEAIILDPVYTSKAMAALIADVEAGKRAGNVVFVHTGGVPSIFAQPELFA